MTNGWEPGPHRGHICCRQLLLAAAFWAALPLLASAGTLAPRRPHQPERYAAPDYAQPFARLVVKFHDGSGVRARGGRAVVDPALQDAAGLDGRRLSATAVRADVETANALLARHALTLEPLIRTSEADARSTRLRAEAYWGRELAELPTYVQAVLPDQGRDARLPRLVAMLGGLSAVEIAYPEPLAAPIATDELATPPEPWGSCAAVPLDAGAGDLSAQQGYLHAPPAGLDVAAAHAVPGGRGEGVRVIDIEGGYVYHSDHPPMLMLVGHTNQYWYWHGNAVVGVIGGQDNGIGITGLAPSAAIGLRSIYNANLFDDWAQANGSSVNVASHIYWAAKHSLEGVVLIELQRPGPAEPGCPCGSSCAATPMEYWPAEFDTIETAVGNGVTVVQAAANGGRSLDHAIFADLFNRTVRDSGAILVSGSHSDGVTPVCNGGGGPNFGSRIDVHSWSEGVVTTSRDFGPLYDGVGHCNDYSQDFNGTSSASAIVAGAAAALQGVHRAAHGGPMDPLALRALMVDTGTPQQPGVIDQWIGPQPDLGQAVQAILEGN